MGKNLVRRVVRSGEEVDDTGLLPLPVLLVTLHLKKNLVK